MAARKSGRLAKSERGLERAVTEATHPTMKRLGERAIKLGFSQESLAKALRERFALRIIGANVKDHFTRKHPQPVTIERYAKVLGVSDDELQILRDGALKANRLRDYEHEVFRLLALFRTDFASSTEKAVKDALGDQTARTRVLTQTALDWNAPPPQEWAALPAQLSSFAAALCPYLDLRRYLRSHSKGEETLYMIYGVALNVYEDHAKALGFADACAAILRLDGFDTSSMYEYLRDVLQGSHDAANRALPKKGRVS